MLSISDFVHISGGFSFIKGATLTVDVQTNTTITSTPALGAIPIPAAAATARRRLALGERLDAVRRPGRDDPDHGIHAASLLIGYNPNESGGTFDVGDDGILTQEPLSDDAIGFLASNIQSLGVVLSTIQPTLAAAGAGAAAAVHDDQGLRRAGRRCRARGLPHARAQRGARRGQHRRAVGWRAVAGAPGDPLVEEFDGGDGYAVSTGEGNPPVVLDMEGYLIGGGADLFVLGISEFVHLRGAAYFEMGAVATVPLSSVIDLERVRRCDSAGRCRGHRADREGAPVPQLRRRGRVRVRRRRRTKLAHRGSGRPDERHPLRVRPDPGRLRAACPTTATADDKAGSTASRTPRPTANAAPSATSTPIGIAVADLDFAFAMGTPRAPGRSPRATTRCAREHQRGRARRTRGRRPDRGAQGRLARGQHLDCPGIPGASRCCRRSTGSGTTSTTAAPRTTSRRRPRASRSVPPARPFGVKTGRIVNTEDGTPGGTQCDLRRWTTPLHPRGRHRGLLLRRPLHSRRRAARPRSTSSGCSSRAARWRSSSAATVDVQLVDGDHRGKASPR